MLKLYRKLKPLDIFYVLLIIGFTVLQVYLTMTLVDYVQNIIKTITYINLHNNPDSIMEGFSKLLEAMGGWDSLKDASKINIPNVALTDEVKTQIANVANATVGDIWFNGGMMLLLAFGMMIVQGVISVLASNVAANLSTRIRKDLYEKIETFSLYEMDKFSTASLVTRTTNDIQQIQLANLLTMRMIFQAPITAIWAIVKIQATSTELTITTAATILLLVAVIAIIMVIALPKFKVMQKLTDDLNASTRDNLTGMRIVRAFNANKYQENKFDNSNMKFTKAQLFTGRILAILSPFMMIIMNGLSLSIYLIGSYLINNGETNYATVTSFVMLGTQIVMAFVMLLMLFILWPRAIVAAKRINEVYETDPIIKNTNNPVEFTEKGTIEFKDVAFKYPNGENNVISNISFKVNKGETLAIIGATSSGKTTLINLISRLYDATEGSVIVDGCDVKNVNIGSLRERIGFVPQKGFLFKGTIKDNIAFSDDNIDMEKVKYSAEVACAKDFIEEREEGYDYLISQSGKNVSGGQRQRLCIARCVYRSPEIYVFDDSFSALDYKTDKKVRENLANLDNDATKIIVAQRIGTIMDADKIIVLDNGEMVGYGKHEELLKTSSVYKEIALSQLSEKELGL